MKLKHYLYWLIPFFTWLPQLLMSLNSFSQMRFEELIESVQAVYWFDHHLIISGLHVNVGWYALLLVIYKLFGFSLYSGKIVYLVASFISTFVLFYLLKKFFTGWVAGLILITITLSPTLLYMNAVSLHWAMTFHLLIIILLLLYKLDFSNRKLSFLLTGVIFLLMMVMWLFYQAVVFYLPSLVIFYWLKYRIHLRGEVVRWNKAHPGGVMYGMTAVVAFLLPLVILFSWVDNKNLLILDPDTGTGLFRGGGKFVLSEEVFLQAWRDFFPDFFVKGVSHHYEVASAEFSLVFPIITLAFVFGMSFRLLKHNSYITLAYLVMAFDLLVFSTTSDLGLPGMKRLTPMLASIYFLWVIIWYYLGRLPRPSTSLRARNDGLKKNVAYLILSLLTIHHLIVYPINLIHIKDPSPFKVADWFDEENPQKRLDEYVAIAKKEGLALDCRPIVAQGGGCFYDFIYPAVAGSCEFNQLSCHQILGYSGKDNKFIPLSIDLWQNKFFDQ